MNKGAELRAARTALEASFKTSERMTPQEACRARAALREYRRQRDQMRKLRRRKSFQYALRKGRYGQ